MANWPAILERPKLKLCAVAMLDLLGYGVQLLSASGQLGHPAGILAIQRIREFHRTAMLLSPPENFRVFRLNDAAVVVRDIDSTPEPNTVVFHENLLNALSLTPTGARQVWEFIEWARDLHDEVKMSQRENGYPGARSIVVVGERTADDDVLNLNMAFATAYLADQAGSAKGFRGDELFIEHLVFQQASMMTGRSYDGKTDVHQRAWISDVDILGRKRSFIQCTWGPKDSPPGLGVYVSVNDKDWKTKLPTEHGRTTSDEGPDA